MTVVLGLTGSIGMGKSTTAGYFREAGVPVWDADATVHRLYGPGGAAVAPLARLCPAASSGSTVDRSALKAWIASDPSALGKIEAIVHPLVAADRAEFVSGHRTAGTPLVVVDIPLLFETGADALCDATLVVSAPPDVQRARVLSRPGMTEETFRTLLAKQMADSEKRERASHVIETIDHEEARAAVLALIAELTKG
jgi:dephospho-CoA kinase